MTAVVLVVLGAVFALAVRYLATAAVRWIRLRRLPERTDECTCGALMPISKAHLLVAVFSEREEAEHGGMTAVSAAYCRSHCPGGCNHPKEH